ncbi:uncharacterized protein LOC133357462 [Lethenteron reissneri]|uniref:uncharacterized protein LOC133357462 n=1 Tax=Lethenteron reissneri TaxID=7753 RepID=UPI002AB7377C|nr:uncharacterized protein LOC133357462 [Lethenteron reissneri]
MDRRGMPPNSSYAAASHVPPSPQLNITAGAATCAEPWDLRTVAYPAVYGAVFLVGLAGNAAALWVFAFRTRARSAATVYMANLAASDLLLVLTLPFHGAYHALGGHWVFGEAACRVAGVLFFGSMYVSVTSLALVGVERYHAVLHPTRRRGSARRPRNARVVCALLWLVHACGAARVLAMEHTARVPPRPSFRSLRHDSALQQLQDQRGWRIACFESHSREVVYASLLGYAVSFVAPLAVLIYCYACIALRLRGGGPGQPGELATLGGSLSGGGGTSPARTHTRERSLRSVRLTMAVFVLCYVPFHATRVMELLVRYAGDPSLDGHCRLLTVATVAHRVALALSVTNAALDPVVYYCTASSFRRELRQMFARCCAPRPASAAAASAQQTDSYKYPVYSAVYGIVFIIGITGNSIALYVFLHLTRTKLASTIYFINLALADMFFVLILPLRVVYYVRDGDWPFGDVMCRISSFAFYVNLYGSIFFLTGLSVTRYLAVVHPVRSLKAVTARRAVIACVSIWVFVALLTSPFLLNGQHVTSSGRTLCFESKSGGSLVMILAMNYIALVIGVLVPFATIVACYVAIARTLMNSPMAQRRDSNACKRAVRMIVLVLAVFVVCFIPYHVQRTLLLHKLINRHSSCDTKLYLQKSVVATVCFAAFNSCLDPLIYFFVGEKFRERFMSAVRRRARITSATSSVRSKDPLARSTTRDGAKLHMQPLEGSPQQKEEPQEETDERQTSE